MSYQSWGRKLKLMKFHFSHSATYVVFYICYPSKIKYLGLHHLKLSWRKLRATDSIQSRQENYYQISDIHNHLSYSYQYTQNTNVDDRTDDHTIYGNFNQFF